MHRDLNEKGRMQKEEIKPKSTQLLSPAFNNATRPFSLRFVVSQEIAQQDMGVDCDQGVWSRVLSMVSWRDASSENVGSASRRATHPQDEKGRMQKEEGRNENQINTTSVSGIPVGRNVDGKYERPVVTRWPD